ncbi:galactosamine-6-phosphate isomerase [Flavobacteriaceae bacterium MAR_2010_188]|nr:galactosamine-6-phosphate isomerase [Flavobacteriaceae bacterium MAR_2010_188]
MNIHSFEDYEQMSGRAAAMVLEEIEKKKDLLICAPTGNSPTGMYQSLAQTFQQKPKIFNELRVLKLDEWVGLPAEHPGSCEYYLRQQLLDPLKISADRYAGFLPNPENPQNDCERVKQLIENGTGIDLCILGLGKNGHIGFNEPAEFLQPHCHVAQLSEQSKKQGIVEGYDEKPEYGITLGMQEILSAKKIILLVYGEGKRDATAVLLSKNITTEFPATFLWLHPNVDCLLVKD